MNSDTKHDRDPFTLSLGGIRVVNSHAMASAIADNGINRTWDARLGRSPKTAGPDLTALSYPAIDTPQEAQAAGC